MSRFPDDDQIATALLWLRSNEGEGAEGESCRAVADWLETEQTSHMLRRAARKGGVPLKALRQRLESRR